jgi:hypothetical protein
MVARSYGLSDEESRLSRKNTLFRMMKRLTAHPTCGSAAADSGMLTLDTRPIIGGIPTERAQTEAKKNFHLVIFFSVAFL